MIWAAHHSAPARRHTTQHPHGSAPRARKREPARHQAVHPQLEMSRRPRAPSKTPSPDLELRA